MVEHQRSILRPIAVAIALAFTAEQAAFAAPAMSPIVPASLKPHMNFKLPESVAVVDDSYKAPGSGKLLILIQDAHTNDSAQMNLAKALEEILPKENIATVFTEADSGDISLGFMKPYFDQKVREDVSRQLVRKGIMRGHDYASVAGKTDFTLWGVEDPALYEESVKTYKDITLKRDKARAYIDRVQRAAEVLKGDLFSDTVKTLDAKRASHLKGDLSLADYSEVLLKEIPRAKLNPAKYPHIKFLRRLRSLEKRIDFKAASQEEREALKTFPKEDQEELLSAHKKLSKTRSSGTEENGFYALLADKLGKNTPKFPNLKRYFQYLKETRKMNGLGVIGEVQSLEEDLFLTLAKSKDEAVLWSFSKNLESLQNLISLKLTPSEFERMKTQEALYNIGVISGFLNRKIVDLDKHFENAIAMEEAYSKAWSDAVKFYELTLKRDRVFMEQVQTKMDQANIDRAVLITGGYHTPNLKELLKSSGYSYVSLLPQVLHETDTVRYEKILLSQLDKKGNITGSTDSRLASAGRPATKEAVLPKAPARTTVAMALAGGANMAQVPARLAAELSEPRGAAMAAPVNPATIDEITDLQIDTHGGVTVPTKLTMHVNGQMIALERLREPEVQSETVYSYLETVSVDGREVKGYVGARYFMWISRHTNLVTQVVADSDLQQELDNYDVATRANLTQAKRWWHSLKGKLLISELSNLKRGAAMAAPTKEDLDALVAQLDAIDGLSRQELTAQLERLVANRGAIGNDFSFNQSILSDHIPLLLTTLIEGAGAKNLQRSEEQARELLKAALLSLFLETLDRGSLLPVRDDPDYQYYAKKLRNELGTIQNADRWHESLRQKAALLAQPTTIELSQLESHPAFGPLNPPSRFVVETDGKAFMLSLGQIPASSDAGDHVFEYHMEEVTAVTGGHKPTGESFFKFTTTVDPDGRVTDIVAKVLRQPSAQAQAIKEWLLSLKGQKITDGALAATVRGAAMAAPTAPRMATAEEAFGSLKDFADTHGLWLMQRPEGATQGSKYGVWVVVKPGLNAADALAAKKALRALTMRQLARTVDGDDGREDYASQSADLALSGRAYADEDKFKFDRVPSLTIEDMQGGAISASFGRLEVNSPGLRRELEKMLERDSVISEQPMTLAINGTVTKSVRSRSGDAQFDVTFNVVRNGTDPGNYSYDLVVRLTDLSKQYDFFVDDKKQNHIPAGEPISGREPAAGDGLRFPLGESGQADPVTGLTSFVVDVRMQGVDSPSVTVGRIYIDLEGLGEAKVLADPDAGAEGPYQFNLKGARWESARMTEGGAARMTRVEVDIVDGDISTAQADAVLLGTSNREEINAGASKAVKDHILGNIRIRGYDRKVRDVFFATLYRAGEGGQVDRVVSADQRIEAGALVLGDIIESEDSVRELNANGWNRIYLAVVADTENYERLTQEQLFSVIKGMLLIADKAGHESVALPLIGAGEGGASEHISSLAIMRAVRELSDSGQLENIRRIQVVAVGKDAYRALASARRDVWSEFHQAMANEEVAGILLNDALPNPAYDTESGFGKALELFMKGQAPTGQGRRIEIVRSGYTRDPESSRIHPYGSAVRIDEGIYRQWVTMYDMLDGSADEEPAATRSKFIKFIGHGLINAIQHIDKPITRPYGEVDSEIEETISVSSTAAGYTALGKLAHLFGSVDPDKSILSDDVRQAMLENLLKGSRTHYSAYFHAFEGLPVSVHESIARRIAQTEGVLNLTAKSLLLFHLGAWFYYEFEANADFDKTPTYKAVVALLSQRIKAEGDKQPLDLLREQMNGQALWRGIARSQPDKGAQGVSKVVRAISIVLTWMGKKVQPFLNIRKPFIAGSADEPRASVAFPESDPGYTTIPHAPAVVIARWRAAGIPENTIPSLKSLTDPQNPDRCRIKKSDIQPMSLHTIRMVMGFIPNSGKGSRTMPVNHEIAGASDPSEPNFEDGAKSAQMIRVNDEEVSILHAGINAYAGVNRAARENGIYSSRAEYQPVIMGDSHFTHSDTEANLASIGYKLHSVSGLRSGVAQMSAGLLASYGITPEVLGALADNVFLAFHTDPYAPVIVVIQTTPIDMRDPTSMEPVNDSQAQWPWLHAWALTLVSSGVLKAFGEGKIVQGSNVDNIPGRINPEMAVLQIAMGSPALTQLLETPAGQKGGAATHLEFPSWVSAAARRTGFELSDSPFVEGLEMGEAVESYVKDMLLIKNRMMGDDGELYVTPEDAKKYFEREDVKKELKAQINQLLRDYMGWFNTANYSLSADFFGWLESIAGLTDAEVRENSRTEEGRSFLRLKLSRIVIPSMLRTEPDKFKFIAGRGLLQPTALQGAVVTYPKDLVTHVTRSKAAKSSSFLPIKTESYHNIKVRRDFINWLKGRSYTLQNDDEDGTRRTTVGVDTKFEAISKELASLDLSEQSGPQKYFMPTDRSANPKDLSIVRAMGDMIKTFGAGTTLEAALNKLRDDEETLNVINFEVPRVMYYHNIVTGRPGSFALSPRMADSGGAQLVEARSEAGQPSSSARLVEGSVGGASMAEPILEPVTVTSIGQIANGELDKAAYLVQQVQNEGEDIDGEVFPMQVALLDGRPATVYFRAEVRQAVATAGRRVAGKFDAEDVVVITAVRPNEGAADSVNRWANLDNGTVEVKVADTNAKAGADDAKKLDQQAAILALYRRFSQTSAGVSKATSNLQGHKMLGLVAMTQSFTNLYRMHDAETLDLLAEHYVQDEIAIQTDRPGDRRVLVLEGAHYALRPALTLLIQTKIQRYNERNAGKTPIEPLVVLSDKALLGQDDANQTALKDALIAQGIDPAEYIVYQEGALSQAARDRRERYVQSPLAQFQVLVEPTELDLKKEANFTPGIMSKELALEIVGGMDGVFDKPGTVEEIRTRIAGTIIGEDAFVRINKRFFPGDQNEFKSRTEMTQALTRGIGNRVIRFFKVSTLLSAMRTAITAVRMAA